MIEKVCQKVYLLEDHRSTIRDIASCLQISTDLVYSISSQGFVPAKFVGEIHPHGTDGATDKILEGNISGHAECYKL